MTTDWNIVDLAGFDLESTGVKAFEDRIVTACFIEVPLDSLPTPFTWLVNPGIEIPEEATAVHGITTEDVIAHGDEPGHASFEISATLALWMGQAKPVVAYNGVYDFTMLEAENRRHGNPTLAERLAPLPIGPVIDPYVLDKHIDPYRKGGRKLADLCAHYGIELIDAHTAEADAAAAVELARKILSSHDEFAAYTPGGLHMAQKQWRAQQMASLRSYFDKKGIEHDGCDPGFPTYKEVA